MPDPIDLEAHKRAVEEAAECKRMSEAGDDASLPELLSAAAKGMRVAKFIHDQHPALIAEIERLQAENERLSTAIEDAVYRLENADVPGLEWLSCLLTAALEGGR